MVVNIKDNGVIIEDNLKLVHFIIHRYHGNIVRAYDSRGLTYEDVFQIGCEGLIKAANTFDKGLGFTFSTYAKSVISNEINKFFRDYNTTIKFSRLAKIAALKVINEKNITKEIIMEKSGCSLSIATQAIHYINNLNVKGLDEKVYGDEEDTYLIDTIESCDDDIDFKILYGDFISTLNERRRIILELLTSGFNQGEISKELGISQPHVSREIKSIRDSIKEYGGGELCVL